MSFIEIWKARNQIIEGVKNNIFKNEHVEQVAQQRLTVCATCSNRDDEGTSCKFPGIQPCCSLCGCSLQLKARSLSSDCPDDKWNALVTMDEEMLIKDQIMDCKDQIMDCTH